MRRCIERFNRFRGFFHRTVQQFHLFLNQPECFTGCRYNSRPITDALAALADGFHRHIGVPLNIVYELCDILRRQGGLFSQFPDFIRHYGKAPAGLTGACRFYRRVQCQEIRLSGNIGNRLHDGTYLGRTLAQCTDNISRDLDLLGDIFNLCYSLPHSLTPICRLVFALLCGFGHHLRTGMEFMHMFAHTNGTILQIRDNAHLLIRSICQVHRAIGHHLNRELRLACLLLQHFRRFRHTVGRFIYAQQKISKLIPHHIGTGCQFTDFILGFRQRFAPHITIGNFLYRSDCTPQRPQRSANNPPGENPHQGGNNQHGYDGRENEFILDVI